VQKTKGTLCIRCGRERIIAKSWSEYIGTSKVTYTSYVCPDKICQKIVEEEFKKKKARVAEIQRNALKRKKNNKRNKKK
jgi:uncharacterized membrane protein